MRPVPVVFLRLAFSDQLSEDSMLVFGEVEPRPSIDSAGMAEGWW